MESNQIEILKMENTKSEIKNYRLYTTKSDLLSKIIEEYREKIWKCRRRNETQKTLWNVVLYSYYYVL